MLANVANVVHVVISAPSCRYLQVVFSSSASTYLYSRGGGLISSGHQLAFSSSGLFTAGGFLVRRRAEGLYVSGGVRVSGLLVSCPLQLGEGYTLSFPSVPAISGAFPAVRLLLIMFRG